jgi:hypothetical protein
MPHISLSFDPNNICLGALKSEKKCHSDGVHKYTMAKQTREGPTAIGTSLACREVWGKSKMRLV